jgi:YVTN family beta-propeller protein
MHITRQRREASRLGLGLPDWKTRRLLVAAVSATVLVTGAGLASATTQPLGQQQVGTTGENGLVLSNDQVIAPYGDRLLINTGKLMSSTLSPNGKYLAATLTGGGQTLAIIDTSSWTIKQTIGSTLNGVTVGSDVGQEGPTYSPDGTKLWMGEANGYRIFTVNADGTLANPVFITIPAVSGKQALVGAAVFSADGSTVYAVVNGQNTVVAINAATGAVTATWKVGIAPRGLALVGGKLYVSNEGGRLAQPGDTTVDSYGTPVPSNPDTGASITGTVSVIDTANPAAAAATISVGVHPTAVYAKNGTVFVTNTSDDTVSVIDPAKGAVVQTIATQPWPDASVGYQPTALTLTDDGHLLVTLSGANAVAVYKYTTPMAPVSFVGLLPTDYVPSEIGQAGNQIVVSNTRGIDARRKTGTSHTTGDSTSSITHFQLPSDDKIKGMTGTVFTQNGWNGDQNLAGNPNGKAQPTAIPVKLGDPSTIKYVFMIVKENRTYDQVFGDMPQGNGDPSKTTYGNAVTPNQHAMAAQFGLYDNTYDPGSESAEGNNFMSMADDPAYSESMAGQYIRTYGTRTDALGHQKPGFIWTGAQAAGKTVKDFGYYQSIEQKPAGATWPNLYCDAQNMNKTGAPSAYPIKTGSDIPSLNAVSVPGYPVYDLNVPDIYRTEVWKQDFEKNGPANLNTFWLPTDHTGGPISGPAAVADNDLALGRIVDTISHSKYWSQSAIFVAEDDSQAGSDHVDGHRAPVQIISPWAQHGVTDSHYYSQITIMRTMEQILGIQPMNIKDTAATPMRQAFTNKPDLTPFNAVPNQTSLTAGAKTLPPCNADGMLPAK